VAQYGITMTAPWAVAWISVAVAPAIIPSVSTGRISVVRFIPTTVSDLRLLPVVCRVAGMTSTHNVLTAVSDRFGIQLSETMTGGGCMALHARLETGHWIVAVDDMLMSLASRIDYETDSADDYDDGGRRPAGWSVGIYPDMGADSEWSGADSVVDVVDYDLFAEDLPEVIGRALALFVSSQLATVTRSV
jgi:hypothetical protein